MEKDLTLRHALSKNSLKELRDLADRFHAEEPINPNAGKQKLIEELVPVIPENIQERIIDNTFNTPKTRYTAHLGNYHKELPNENEIKNNCLVYNRDHDYNPELKDYQTNRKAQIELVDYSEELLTFYFTEFTKRLDYNDEALESRPIISSRRIKIEINVVDNQVTVFTGDKDLFNAALTALTIVLSGPVTPLDLNKTGISEVTRGSFSFHTVKALDFIYHGLSTVGRIGALSQIELETGAKSKKPQKVKVQGEELLDDKSICEYLFLYSRDLVGIKLDFTFVDCENEFKSSIEIGMRDSRIKIGVKKDNYSIEKVKEFFTTLESVAQNYLRRPGLINEGETIKILDSIRTRAIS